MVRNCTVNWILDPVPSPYWTYSTNYRFVFHLMYVFLSHPFMHLESRLLVEIIISVLVSGWVSYLTQLLLRRVAPGSPGGPVLPLKEIGSSLFASCMLVYYSCTFCFLNPFSASFWFPFDVGMSSHLTFLLAWILPSLCFFPRPVLDEAVKKVPILGFECPSFLFYFLSSIFWFSVFI